MTQLVTIALDRLDAPAWARPVDASKIGPLAASIAEVGLLQPVVARVKPGGFEIVAGRHRVEALRSLGEDAAPCRLVDAEDDLVAELMLIDENLLRNDLSPAQRAAATARRKAIHEALHPETRHGGDRRSSRQVGDLKPEAPRFTEATARATGRSERQVQRESARGEAIPAEQLARVVGTPLDKGDEIDALARLTPKRRETVIARAAAGERVSAKAEVKKERREEREAELGARQRALPEKRYGVIYADPEWRFDPWSRETGLDRAADNHYPTSETLDIVTRPVGDIAAADCVLFLWATAPMLLAALRVMEGWGFAYKSHFVWRKDRIGTGYWNRNEHELLLVGTRGDVVAPAPGTQWPSVVSAGVLEHSEKPEIFAELIESYFPTLPKIELNARRARPGWDAWGNEAPEEEDGRDSPERRALSPATEEEDIPAFLRRGADNAVVGRAA